MDVRVGVSVLVLVGTGTHTLGHPGTSGKVLRRTSRAVREEARLKAP